MKTCKMQTKSVDLVSPDIVPDKPTSPVKSQNGTRARRKAATKAQGRVAEFVRQMKAKFEGESSEAEIDEDISDEYDTNIDGSKYNNNNKISMLIFKYFEPFIFNNCRQTI